MNAHCDHVVWVFILYLCIYLLPAFHLISIVQSFLLYVSCPFAIRSSSFPHTNPALPTLSLLGVRLSDVVLRQQSIFTSTSFLISLMWINWPTFPALLVFRDTYTKYKEALTSLSPFLFHVSLKPKVSRLHACYLHKKLIWCTVCKEKNVVRKV
jgi:hypothetical protein